jgi:DNA polymerase-4
LVTGDGAATILHADLDAFYASVEQLLDPSLCGRPLAVGGGVVLAASYEARRFGVRAGMPGGTARRLCPSLRFVTGHFREYQSLADQVMEVFGDFTPLVERVSIDEAFLDVAGATRLFGSPSDIGLAIRGRVLSEIGLAVSVGVARTKHLAKIASQVAKPDGLVVVDPGEEREFLDPLPVELVWGVGPSTRRRLASVGIRSIGDLAGAGGDGLEGLLGRATGAKLASLAANRDPRRIETGRSASSIGAQAALGSQVPTPRLIRSTIGYLADRVAGRLRASARAGRTVTVRVRFGGLRSVTRSVTPPAAVSATLTLTEIAVELVSGALADHPRERRLTLLGVSAANLVREPDLQLELPLEPLGPSRPGGPSGLSDPPDPACQAGRRAADRAVDAIRARFGRSSVGYADLGWSENARAPEAFRELAERPVGPDRRITP